jgi:hypothetical protein
MYAIVPKVDSTDTVKKTAPRPSWLSSNYAYPPSTAVMNTDSGRIDDAPLCSTVAENRATAQPGDVGVRPTIAENTVATHFNDSNTDPEEPQVETVEPATDKILDSSVAHAAHFMLPRQFETSPKEVSHQIHGISASPIFAADAPLMPACASIFYHIIIIIVGAAFLQLAIRGPKFFFVAVWWVAVLMVIYAIARAQLGVSGRDPLLRLLESSTQIPRGWVARTYDAALQELAAKIVRKMREEEDAEEEMESMFEYF